MTFDKGSLVLVDYTAKVKDTGEVFDTTIADVAKEHSINQSNSKYQPKLISLGDISYPVLKGFDEALAQTNVGDKLTIEVTPDKAFGERDPGKVRMIPIRKLGDDADKVSVGDSIEIDDKRGIIRYIGSGRVQIDYNHKYAGKTILYDVNVLKSLDTPNDKIDAILKTRFTIDNTKISFNLDEQELLVLIPSEIFRADGLQITKHFIQSDIFKFVPDLQTINFIEKHQNPQTPKPDNSEKITKEKTA